jgi:hypothetical protein
MPSYQSGGAFLPGADYLLAGDIVIPGQRYPITIQAVDGPIPILSGIVKLTKGSVAAMTLGPPTAIQEGIELTITSGSAFAHVITATGLLQNGVTGGAKSTMTMAAFIGARITLLAVMSTAGAGFWHVKSSTSVPVT